MSKNVEIVKAYFNAVTNGDFATIDQLFADDAIWHQPGKGIQSGIYKGKGEIFNHLGNFAKWSQGTFAIDKLEYITENGDLVSASIHFKAKKDENEVAMNGIDLLRIENEKIKEVWLFSENIEDEDTFWNNAAK